MVIPLIVAAACGAPQAAREAEVRQARAEVAAVAALKATRTHIEDVLAADRRIWASKTPEERVGAMRRISLRGCPNDFVAAYEDHTYAWEHLGRIQRGLRDLDTPVAIESARTLSDGARLLHLDATPASDHMRQVRRIEDLRDEAISQIRATYQRVQFIATSYGATLPP